MFHTRWLKELIADAPAGTGSVAVPAAPTSGFAPGPVLVAFATQNGAAESIAEATLEQLEMAGIEADMMDFYDLDLARLADAGQVLFVASTTFDGDPPDMAEAFFQEAMQQPAPLGHLRYGLLARGDRAYDMFCGFGHRLDDWLRASGARPWLELIEVDDEDEQAITRWHECIGMLVAAAGTRAESGRAD